MTRRIAENSFRGFRIAPLCSRHDVLEPVEVLDAGKRGLLGEADRISWVTG